MKIVCESCGAKYSIADERVSGKMFKIRCKRCSEVIVVRGDQPAPQAAETNGAQPQAAIWHAVVEGDQAGPFSPAQLGEMLTNGTVDWDAYVWTEGFENWLPMRDVPDLVAQITGQPQTAAAPVAAQAFRPNTQTLAGQPSMGADPFADDAGPSEAGMFAGGASNGGKDLFAQTGAAASPFGGGAEPGVLASSPSPRMAQQPAMTGARNENSVLFSLKNLQALATGSVQPAAPQAAAAVGGALGAGEGSGLIDIRALATTTGVGEASDGSGHKDELLSIGAQGGAFGTLGSPMLSKMHDDGDGNKKTVIWAVVMGVFLVSVAVVLAAYIMRPPQNAPVSQTVAVAPSAVATPALAQIPQPTAAAAAPSAAIAAASEGELAAKRAAEEAHDADKAHASNASSSSSSGDHHHKHDGSSSAHGSDSSSAPVAAAPAAEPKKPPTKSGPRTIDDLLDGALNSSGSAKPAAAQAAPASNLPNTPSRDDVKSAMGSVAGAVQNCAKGAGGVATVTVNVAGATGRVTTAEVQGVTGPAGSCIAQAVRKAQFPKFAQRVFQITFPYKL